MFIARKPRRWRVGAGLALVVFCTAMPHPDAVRGASLSGRVRLVTATETQVIFEADLTGYVVTPSRHLTGTDVLEIRGFGSFSQPGEPSIPGRDFLVALPPQGEPSVTWRVVRSEPLGEHRLEPVPFPVVREDENGAPFAGEEYRIDAGAYDKSRSAIGVTPEKVVRIRHQRVLPVRVIPVTYDPSTGETVLATLIRIEVSFSQGARGVQGLGDAQTRPVRESQEWGRVLERILINPGQAAGWRTREVVRPQDPTRETGVSEALSGPLVKLLVRDTGLHRVSASAVMGKGFPAGTSVTDLHVFKRGYDSETLLETILDAPCRVVEDPVGVAGVFDGADRVIFYGKSLREDESQEDPLEKFSGANVYWLGSSGGIPMATEPIPAGFVGADTATATFPASEYYEQDNVFFEATPPGEREFYYYNTPGGTSLSLPFTTTSIDPTGTFQLKARFLGGSRSSYNTVLKLSIRNSKGTTTLFDALVDSKDVVLYASQSLQGSVIDEGANTFRIDKTPDRATLDALLDWFTIEYRAKYRAKNNVLEFNSASLSGDTSLVVTGLTSPDVMLFDVTDPAAPREYNLTPGHFTSTGNGFAVSFRQSLSSRKSYVLTTLDGIRQIGSSDIETDNPSGLVGNPAEGGVDILVVSHADFLDEMERWVSYRRAQGYRVLMADVEDVFDEFSGGVPNPRGIKKFMRHFFETGGASFVVLVGDASEDNRHVFANSGPNFVPTESFTEFAAGGFNQDEVVTTDKWYAMLGYDFITDDPPGLNDYYPDLMIGRLPVGSPAELRDVLDKIFKFEDPKGDDFWRRRMIRVADNAFSAGVAFELCYNAVEDSFRAAEESAARTAENAIPGGFDIVRFYVADHLKDVEPPHQPGSCLSMGIFANETRDNVTPALLNELNAGATLVSIQAHMNRYQICHEWLFTSWNVYGVRDHLRLTNTDRPWIVFGMGCHMSDYAISEELSFDNLNRNYPNGDALAELLLLQKAGAVSTYGSSGFEYLTPNENLTKLTATSFFENAPTDTMVASDRAQARWIFGELMTVTEIENLLRYASYGSGDGAVGQTKRFHLLGDPVLRIDAGPPRFEVTVNGAPFTSGDLVAPGADNMIDVHAVITDEVAIEKLSLEIAGADSTDILMVTPLEDQNLSAARQYEVRFQHRIQAKRYDIILRAYQAEDTTAGIYLVAAEFVMKVQASAELTVNGRPVSDGELVPPKGDYVFKIELPVKVDPSLIRVETDGELVVSQTSTEDSMTWLVEFSQELSNGSHEIVLIVDETQFAFTLIVGSHAGLIDLIAYPNPFADDVYFVFTNEIQITKGSIDVFTTTGKKVAHIEIPPQSRSPGQNAVRWDGRTSNGGEIANGVYLFVVSVEQGGQKTTERGKLARVK